MISKLSYVVWGIGEKGKRIFKYISEDIIAFMDSNIEDRGVFFGKPLISPKEYLEKYRDYPIIVTFNGEKEAKKWIEEHKIEKYFFASNLPSYYHNAYYDKRVMQMFADYINPQEKYCIVGTNVFALQIANLVAEITTEMPSIVSENGDECNGWISEYGYKYESTVKEGVILLCCQYMTEEQREYYTKKYNFEYWYYWDEYAKLWFNAAIVKYKNFYRRKRCFIVATGPSLQVEDLDTLYEYSEICISMNFIIKAYEYTQWRPNYYIVEDYRCLEEEPDLLIKNRQSICFVGNTHPKLIDMTLPENVYLHNFIYEYTENRLPDFSKDFSRRCYMGATVTYSCMQLAYYLGFSEVYLLGVDFTHSSGGNGETYGHFYDSGNDKSRFFSQVELAYNRAKIFGDMHGMRIYNATRGGELEIFPRVKFDDLFEIN